MTLPDEIIEKIFKEVIDEIKTISKDNNGKAETFDSLEKRALAIREKFGNKLMQELINQHGTGELTQKKTARNAEKG